MPSSREPFSYDEGFCRNILETLPLPAFVVDSGVRIMHANRAALEFLDIPADKVLFSRVGEVLGCINNTLSPEGCGHSEYCKRCVIRRSVRESIQGGQVRRKKHVVERAGAEGKAATYLLVTTSPLRDERNSVGNGQDESHEKRESLALLMFEDISEVVQLRGIIPVCAWCKKVRDDSQLWHDVEEYFSRRLDVDFTHGICHECAKKLLSEEENNDKPEA